MLKFYKDFHIQPVSDNSGGEPTYTKNYIEIGNPNIDANYIFANSSTATTRPTDFVNMNKLFTVSNLTWEIRTKLNGLDSPLPSGQHHALFGYCGDNSNKRWSLPLVWLGDTGLSNNSKAYLFLSSTGSSWNISNALEGAHVYNGTEFIKLQFTGSQYILSYSLDGNTYTTDITVTSSTVIYNNTETPLSFGAYYGADGNTIKGAINLKETKVYVGSSLYWEAVTKN